MWRAVLFIIAQNWKQAKYQLDIVNKMWCIYLMGHNSTRRNEMMHATKWRTLKNLY